MKISSTIIITLCVLSLSALFSPIHAQAGSSCTADYQCGVPYGYCGGGNVDCTSTYQGLAVDASTSTLYYTASCGINNNATIRKVSANGGPASTIYSEAALQEGGNINKAYTVINGQLYISRIEREPGSQLVTFNLNNNLAQTDVTLNPGFFQPELDISNGNSYTCQLTTGNTNNYTIDRFSGVVGQGGSTNGVTLYSLGAAQCGPLRRGTGTSIVFTIVTVTPTSTTTAFYKGSVAGSKTLPAVYFTVNENVNDFVIDISGAVIYATGSGLFKRAISGATTTIYSGAVYGVAIFNNKIYFNYGTGIRDTNIDGTNQQQVTTQATGTCTCRPGFSGSDCQTCNGQVQWNNGSPSCIATNQAGVPEYCTYDYQCGNVPYTFCEVDSCACRPNFTGSKCDQCASPRTVSWSNGIPSCN